MASRLAASELSGMVPSTSVRTEADKPKILGLIRELGRLATGAGNVYLVGGSSIVLLDGGRDSTIDVDLKLDPEPPGIFEAIATLKNSLDLNIELSAPDQFIPPLPGWRERSRLIETVGSVGFFHYDFYSQALAKLERSHDRDLRDVQHLIESGLIDRTRLLNYFSAIEGDLIRFPAINADQFKRSVDVTCRQP